MSNYNNMITRMDNMENQLHEIIKASNIGSTADLPNSMQIQYSDELKSRTFPKAPFLSFLETKGQVFDNDAALAAFYKENKNSTENVSFIDELDDVPAYNGDTYEEVYDKMKIIISPLEMGMMTQKGTVYMNREVEETKKQFINVNNKADEALCIADKTQDAWKNSFDSPLKSITTNVTDLKGEPITEDAIDDILEAIIDTNGGSPDLILTDYQVLKQLKAIMKDYRRWNDTTEVIPGINVFNYQGPEGTIPIVCDSHLPSGTGKHTFNVIDTSTIEVRRLYPPTQITELPTNKLTDKSAVFTMLTALNIGEFMDGKIINIGEGTTTTSSGS